MSNSSIITCLAWVPQGVAKQHPQKVKFDETQLKDLLKETKITGKKQLSSLGGSGNLKQTEVEGGDNDDDDLAEYDLDNYDSDSTGEVEEGHAVDNLAMYANDRDDPYITVYEDQEDQEDLEDLTINPTDNLIAVGRAEKDVSKLEVYVYNEGESSLYVHHDILLPSFPLAAEWMTFDPKCPDTPGNFVALGYMTPGIDVWDLDAVDCLEPVAKLGKKKKKSKKKPAKPSTGHTDAVLDIAWNRLVRHGLASASADCTIALWDMTQQKVMSSITHHKDKVQTLAWHPFEAQSLASGSFDKSVKVYDCRTMEDNYKSWALDGEVERVVWDRFQPFHFLASTDQGYVYCMDVRTDKSVFTLKAHDDAVTGLSLSLEVDSCLVTASADHTYKVWDIRNDQPSLIVSKDPKMGTINCINCDPNSPFIFALGGEKDGLRMVDAMAHAQVKRHFGKRKRFCFKSTDTVMESNTDHPGQSGGSEVTMETESSEVISKRTVKKKKKKKRIASASSS